MTNEPSKQNQEGIKKVSELMKEMKFAMMTTVETDGRLYSRPMACQQQDFSDELWFFTKKDSGKVESIQKDQHVNLAYANPEEQKYVSVSGLAEVVDDAAKEKELWNPAMKAWFPEGLEDPQLVLIRVRPQTAEYWDSHHSAIVHAIGMAKAVITGESYKSDKSENDRVRFPH